MNKIKVGAIVADFDLENNRVVVRNFREAIVGYADLGLEEISPRDKEQEAIKKDILENIELNRTDNGTRIEISSSVSNEKDEEEKEEYDISSHEDDMLL